MFKPEKKGEDFFLKADRQRLKTLTFFWSDLSWPKSRSLLRAAGGPLREKISEKSLS
jgi:hypothetical protein